MRLILFSSDSSEVNECIDDAASKFFSSRMQITYIPSCSPGCQPYYETFKAYFRRFGCKKFLFLPPDQKVARKELKRAFDSDAIYLSGGNTYYFLKHLKRSGLLRMIRDYAKDDGLVMGISAGSIIMTPNINTAAIPFFDCDENEVAIKAMSSLNLVRFEFSPHAHSSTRYRKEMQRYSKTSKLPLYACKDGAGIIVDGPTLLHVGPLECFFKGQTILKVP